MRLQTDIIDEDQLVKQGKIRFVGASNYDRERFEKSLEKLCIEKRLEILPYFSLAKGFLTEKHRSKAELNKSSRGNSVERYLDDRGMRIITTQHIKLFLPLLHVKV